MGHDFAGVLSRIGKPVDVDFGDTLGGVIDYKVWEGFKIMKIYRQMFSNAGNKLNDVVYPYFNSGKTDVTAKYMPVGSISLQLKSTPKGTKNIYLCVFDNSDWRPVSVSEILDGSVTFMDMGMDIVYLPMRYQNEKFIPVHKPVVLDSWGNSNKLDIETAKFNLVLKRKFFKKTIFKQISVIKAKFQGANKSDFSDAIDLYTITDSLDLANHFVPLDDTTSFRYFRYLFSGELNGQLAEFRVMYQDRNRLEGEIIKDSRLIGNETINSAFDADVLSFANIDIEGENLWYGLDLGSKVKINGVSFCPRTDKNDVWPGLRYELFYWADRWVSLGTKLAESNELTYTSPISGGLFLLRCLTEGREERIFSYQCAKQVWW